MQAISDRGYIIYSLFAFKTGFFATVSNLFSSLWRTDNQAVVRSSSSVESVEQRPGRPAEALVERGQEVSLSPYSSYRVIHASRVDTGFCTDSAPDQCHQERVTAATSGSATPITTDGHATTPATCSSQSLAPRTTSLKIIIFFSW